jgi:predicted RNase H-like HicB family nuclease
MIAFLKRLFSWNRERLEPRFENYRIQTGHTNADHTPYAAIEEFFALSATGETRNDAIRNLKPKFEERIRQMKERGEPIPLPGSGKGVPRFAPNDQIEALRPFVDEFWSEILGASYATSFVSDESRLFSWDHYLAGGRAELIQKVRVKYGVDISAYYDEPIPAVLRRIQSTTA